MVSARRAARGREAETSRGHSFLELLVTAAVLGVLATVVLPVASVARKREKEIELRRALRDIRSALDIYHDMCRQTAGGASPGQAQGAAPGQQAATVIIKVEDDPDRTCWPKELEVLVEGVETNIPRYELRFIRQIPRDPFNASDDEHDAFGWRLLSSTDDPESKGGWNRQNVFDVRSASESQALDGSYYKEW